ncbi:NADH-quinone oxidoreductase subunit NuoF, partial [Myxococcota bacterium]
MVGNPSSSKGAAMDFASIKQKAERGWESLANLSLPLIHIGMGTCGLASGAEDVLAAVEDTIKRIGVLCRVVRVGCIGMCYAEPMMAIRKPGRPFIYYGDLTPDGASEILTSYLLDDDPRAGWALCTRGESSIERIPRFEKLPMIQPQVRIALRNCGLIDPDNISQYIARGGYSGLQRALRMKPDEVIELVKQSGLRGRGGAGFPTGLKWALAAKEPSRPKYIVCNADEGDPGAFMDRSLLEGDPHSVLEGMAIGAYAIGAEEGYVYVRAEYPLAIGRLRSALEQMEQLGLLGEGILEGGFDFRIKIKEGAGAFVCGEETALIASIHGARGMPRSRPPFPAQAGLHGRPTNINNVETFSNVSAIMERGAEWYSSFGTKKSRGTKTFSLAGNVNRPGLIEVPMGIELGTIIHDIGGGVPGGKKLKAVQTGGPSGGCIPASLLSLPVDYESLAEAGSIMGSGGMVVMDEDTCMVDLARYFLSFTHSESCGKCMPCRLGTGRMLDVLEDMCQGRGEEGDLDLLERYGEAVRQASLCGLGQTAPNPVLTAMRYFRSEFDAHVRHRRCPAVACTALFRAPCQHACPLDSDVPAYVALVREGRLDDAYRVLLRTNPFPSVCGRVCDHVCQLKCRRASLDESVAIRNLKRYVTDHGTAPTPSGLSPARSERIAVVGAGPAGLTAARELRLRGYGVTVFESLPEPGGMLRYAIPEYRLPRKVLEREIAAIVNLGVEIETSTRVGEDISWFRILDQHDAIFLAIGAQRSAPLRIPGEELRGVGGAVEFLRQVSLSGTATVGRRVVVIGGGNSAIDAARTAVRLGAEKVRMQYRRLREDMPAQPEEIEAAMAERVEIDFFVNPVELAGSGGRVSRVVCERMTTGPYDESGRKRPVPVENSRFEVEADQVLVAIGQSTEMPFKPGGRGLRVSSRGLVSIEAGTPSATRHPKVFAGGDVVSGPATVVRAIASGFQAAEEIDATIRRRNHEEAYCAPNAEHIAIPGMVDGAFEEGPQETMTLQPLRKRCQDFSEVGLGYSAEQAQREACRCLR